MLPQLTSTFKELDGEVQTLGMQEYMMADPLHANPAPPKNMWPYGEPQWFFRNKIPTPYIEGTYTAGQFSPKHLRPFKESDAFPVFS